MGLPKYRRYYTNIDQRFFCKYVFFFRRNKIVSFFEYRIHFLLVPYRMSKPTIKIDFLFSQRLFKNNSFKRFAWVISFPDFLLYVYIVNSRLSHFLLQLDFCIFPPPIYLQSYFWLIYQILQKITFVWSLFWDIHIFAWGYSHFSAELLYVSQ